MTRNAPAETRALRLSGVVFVDLLSARAPVQITTDTEYEPGVPGGNGMRPPQPDPFFPRFRGNGRQGWAGGIGLGVRGDASLKSRSGEVYKGGNHVTQPQERHEVHRDRRRRPLQAQDQDRRGRGRIHL
jgi:hypothetical protein